MRCYNFIHRIYVVGHKGHKSKPYWGGGGGGVQKNIKLQAQNFILLFEYADTYFFFTVYTDKGAETMFANGEGPVFIESVKWLEDEDSRLQMAAVLAIGNFARNGQLYEL